MSRGGKGLNLRGKPLKFSEDVWVVGGRGGLGREQAEISWWWEGDVDQVGELLLELEPEHWNKLERVDEIT